MAEGGRKELEGVATQLVAPLGDGRLQGGDLLFEGRDSLVALAAAGTRGYVHAAILANRQGDRGSVSPQG